MREAGVLRLKHSIRKQTLELEVASEALALALQPRLGDINRQYLLPVIERVFDELGVGGRRIRIFRLNIDLGKLPLTRFEEVAAERLYRELRRALEEELGRQERQQTNADRPPAEEASHLELLEHYLPHGTLPFWASHDGTAFSFEELVSELAASDPDGLTQIVRTHGRQRSVLERIVLQLGEESLRALLRLLEPAHAALIISYMADLLLIHGAEPVLRLSGGAFARFLWMLVLSYLVRESGSQFNRKSFVKSLLEGMAGSEGLDYLEMVTTLQSGLRETEKRRPLESSLPAVIGELIRDLKLEMTSDERAWDRSSQPGGRTSGPGDEAPAAPEEAPEDVRRTAEDLRTHEAHPALDNRPPLEEASHLELLEYYLLHGTWPSASARTGAFSLAEFLMELSGRDAAGLVRVIRRHGRRGRVLERIVLQLGEESLRALLRLLEPAHAALVISYMLDLRLLHRAEPVLRLGDGAFGRALWILVLSYVVQESGSQFNRKSFVKSLLGGMAESEGLGYAEFVAMIRRGLRETGKRRPLESSLPAVIGELMDELDAASFREESGTQGIAQAAGRAAAPDSPSAEDEALARLELYLSTGQETAVAAREGNPDMRRLFRFLAGRDASRARQLIRQVASRAAPGLPDVVARLLRAFVPEDLLALLAPEQKELIVRLVGALMSVGAQAAPARRVRRAALDSTLWGAALAYILSEPSARWDRRAMVHQVVEAAAENLEVSAASLAETLAGVLGHTTATVGASLAEAVKTVEQALHDPSRPARHARSVFARYDQVEILRYYLRYGVLPWGSLLHDAGLTVAGALASLSGLSRSQLGAVFSQGSTDEQLQAILRAVELMPAESLTRLLRRLLPQAREADSPFSTSFSTFASEAEDRHAFHARLLAAILAGCPLDLEEFASSGSIQKRDVGPPLSADVAEWDAHALKSALASRLRFGEPSIPDAHTLSALLDALVNRHPEEARHFCRALRDAPGLLEALIRQCTTPQFESLSELLAAANSRTLEALRRSVAAVPASYRSHPAESPQQVIFHELLRLEDGHPLTGVFFARVLRKLFGAPLPDEVRALLLREADAWAASEKLPRAHVAAFESAIRTDVQEGARLGKPPRLRDEVFTLLLGERRRPPHPGESGTQAGPPRLDSLSDDALRYTLTLMLEDSPEDVYAFVVEHVKDPRRRGHWVRVLPESALARLSYLLEPRQHRALLDAAEVLASAWMEIAPRGARALAERQQFWGFLLEFMAHHAEAARSVEQLVEAFFKQLAARYRAEPPEAPTPLSVGTRLLEHAARLAGATGQGGLRFILQRQRALLLAPWEGVGPRPPAGRGPTADPAKADQPRTASERHTHPRPERGKMAFSMGAEREDDDVDETIYINNAGLVLAGPFLPHLFQTLGMLRQDEDGRTRFRDPEAVSRAVHLLQYLVDGSTSAPEPFLVLNKFLCGVPAATPVDREIVPTKEEREVCERLLRSMLANWKIISSTSIEGLQETFLRREGKLERADGQWRLRVQRKTVDVLVDQIPWGISIIYHKWMPQPLYVDW